MEQQDNLVGHTLGQYQILDEIGRGGMATVYKAWQPALRRFVALKVLHSHLTTDREFVQRFQQEAISAANLSHSNIVTIYNVAQEDGYYYIAMEYIEGRSLEQLIAQDGVLPQARMLHILGQVAAALDYAHRQKFIHRDIKPANILITAEDHAVITDFGIVKALEGSGVTTSLTTAGTILGTPAYMSPEHIQGQTVDYRTDLYSLGVVCYEMLSGQPPFGGTTTVTILYAQVNNPLPDIRQLNPSVPEYVVGALVRMLSKQPDDRFPSAIAFVDALAEARQGETTLMPSNMQLKPYPQPADVFRPPPVQPDWPQRTAPPSPVENKGRGHRGLIGGLVAGAVLVVLAILILVWKPWIPSTARILEEAQAALAAGNYTEAKTDFDTVLARDPANVAADLGMGEALSAQKKYTQSILYYQAALAADNELADAHAGLAWAYYHAEEYEEAITEFARLIALKPVEAEGYKGKGLSYYALERYEDALEPLKTWTEMEPTSADAHRRLGWACIQLKRYEEAISAFENAIDLNDTSADANYGLGLSYIKVGDDQKASIHFEQATALDPQHFGAYRNLGWRYLQLERYEKSISAFKSALALNDTSADANYGLGLAYVKVGDDQKASVHFEQATVLDPQHFEAYRNLGWRYLRLERYEKSISAFKRALALNDTSADANYGLGLAYVKVGDDQKASVHFEQATVLDPQHFEAYRNLGWTYLRLERYEEAAAAFESAIALDETSTDALYGAGKSAWEIGDCDRAIGHYQEMLTLSPDDERAKKGLERCGQ